MRQIILDGFYIGNNSIVFRPVDCVATSNINVNNIVGNTIAGISVTSITRVLLTAQTNSIENGIYLNNARTPDLSGDENGYGLIVYDINTLKFWTCNATRQTVIGTNAISFQQYSLNNLSDFNITNPVNGQILTYNNGNWVNSNLNRTYNIPIAELTWQGSGTYTLGLTLVNTWYRIAPSTTLLTNNALLGTNIWSSSISGRLDYGGTQSGRYFLCQASLSISNNLSNNTLECAFVTNNTLISKTIIRQRLTNNSDMQSITLNNVLQLNPGDNLDVFIRSINLSLPVLSVFNFSVTVHEMTAYY